MVNRKMSKKVIFEKLKFALAYQKKSKLIIKLLPEYNLYMMVLREHEAHRLSGGQ
jgi:hypothetical protein